MSETVTNIANMPAAGAKPNAGPLKSALSVSGTQQISQSFDRTAHQPFRLDHKGFNRDVTLKDQVKSGERLASNEGGEVKIPSQWTRKSETNPNRTFTELQHNRRKGFIPDMSFDLDGDGIVGNRDLVLSKLFDKDGDGKLNAEERKAAEEAIRNGIDNKMVWNVEQSGVQRSFRIMQKRGVVVDNDDFQAIKDTYPEHHSSKNQPASKTFGELRERRRDSNRKKIDAFNQTFEAKRQKYLSVDKPYIHSEFYQQGKPKFTSIKQRIENDKQEARKKVNLTDVIQDQKDEVGAPSLSFVSKPKIAAKSVLEQHRRQQMLNELKGMEKNVGNHADSYQRMNDRENCSLRVIFNMAPSKMTRQQLDQKRRAEMVAENTQKFGNVTIGIHGGELPKFAENMGSKEWWRLQHAKKEDPQIQSRLLLKQTQQYWAKNDQTLLSDMVQDAAPIDPFKTTHVAQMGLKQVPSKVNNVVHCSDQALLKPAEVSYGYRNQISWSTQTNDTRCVGNDRTFDKIVASGIAKENAEAHREKKLQEYKAQPQRGTMRGGMKQTEKVGQQDQFINRQDNLAVPKVSANQVNSHRSGAQAQSKMVAPGNQRSVSQLETLETGTNHNDSAIMSGAKNVGGLMTTENNIQFGFTTGGGMKATLFSRMSPSAKGANSGVSTFAEVAKNRTQGSTHNVGAVSLQSGSAPQSVNSPVARTGGNTNVNATVAAQRNARSPFKDAMQKGVLSGAGLLTH